MAVVPRMTFRGHKFDVRTVRMIQWAEKKAGIQFNIAQGSYNPGVVAASAGVHDKGGAVDLSLRGLNSREIDTILKAMKDAGFAAWHRIPSQGFPSEHIHGIAIGCRDLAPIAARQVQSFDAHKDGLKSNLIDPSYHPAPKVQFNIIKNKPVPRV